MRNLFHNKYFIPIVIIFTLCLSILVVIFTLNQDNKLTGKASAAYTAILVATDTKDGYIKLTPTFEQGIPRRVEYGRVSGECSSTNYPLTPDIDQSIYSHATDYAYTIDWSAENGQTYCYGIWLDYNFITYDPCYPTGYDTGNAILPSDFAPQPLFTASTDQYGFVETHANIGGFMENELTEVTVRRVDNACSSSNHPLSHSDGVEVGTVTHSYYPFLVDNFDNLYFIDYEIEKGKEYCYAVFGRNNYPENDGWNDSVTAANYATGNTPDGPLIETYFVSPYDDQLRKIDLNFGANATDSYAITLSGKTVTAGAGISINPANCEVWGLLTLDGQTNTELVKINLNTGVAESLITLDDIYTGITFSSTGDLYGVTGPSATNPEVVYKIDTTDYSQQEFVTLTQHDELWFNAIAFGSSDSYLYHSSVYTLDHNVQSDFEKISISDPTNKTSITLTNTNTEVDIPYPLGMFYYPPISAFVVSDNEDHITYITEDGVSTYHTFIMDYAQSYIIPSACSVSGANPPSQVTDVYASTNKELYIDVVSYLPNDDDIEKVAIRRVDGACSDTNHPISHTSGVSIREVIPTTGDTFSSNTILNLYDTEVVPEQYYCYAAFTQNSSETNGGWNDTVTSANMATGYAKTLSKPKNFNATETLTSKIVLTFLTPNNEDTRRITLVRKPGQCSASNFPKNKADGTVVKTYVSSTATYEPLTSISYTDTSVNPGEYYCYGVFSGNLANIWTTETVYTSSTVNTGFSVLAQGDTPTSEEEPDDVILDSDGDGLPDETENQIGTDPNNKDTDTDTLLDGEEVKGCIFIAGTTTCDKEFPPTDPLAIDTDNDGLADNVEVNLGTDPTQNDSDSDGLIDGEEVFGCLYKQGSTKCSDALFDPLNPLKNDTDDNGQKDKEQVISELESRNQDGDEKEPSKESSKISNELLPAATSVGVVGVTIAALSAAQGPSSFGILIGTLVRRRKKYWGFVYDESSHKPIAFAVLKLYQGKTFVAEAVSDMYGRYLMSVSNPGVYTLLVEAADGYLRYEKQVNLSSLTNEFEVLLDIGMHKSGTAKRFYLSSVLKTLLINLNKLLVVLMFGGFVYSALMLKNNSSALNYIIMLVYALLFAVNLYIVVKPFLNKSGFVVDSNGNPVPSASLRFYDESKQLGIFLTDAKGKAKINLKSGKYWVTVNKQGYRPVQLEDIMVDKSGQMTINVELNRDTSTLTSGLESPF